MTAVVMVASGVVLTRRSIARSTRRSSIVSTLRRNWPYISRPTAATASPWPATSARHTRVSRPDPHTER